MMSTTDDRLSGLVERLEKATEGSRELDCLIFEAGHKLLTAERRGTYYGEPTGQYFDLDGNPLPGLAPFYTSSLDSAMTLIPKGFNWASDPHFEQREFRVYRPYDGITQHHFSAIAPTPALALCIAALKAKSRSPQP
jgi:hypothetical protein